MVHAPFDYSIYGIQLFGITQYSQAPIFLHLPIVLKFYCDNPYVIAPLNFTTCALVVWLLLMGIVRVS